MTTISFDWAGSRGMLPYPCGLLSRAMGVTCCGFLFAPTHPHTPIPHVVLRSSHPRLLLLHRRSLPFLCVCACFLTRVVLAAQEGVKKGMRFHHHQLEKVKKHQRSHTTNQARVPRDQGESGLPVVEAGFIAVCLWCRRESVPWGDRQCRSSPVSPCGSPSEVGRYSGGAHGRIGM